MDAAVRRMQRGLTKSFQFGREPQDVVKERHANGTWSIGLRRGNFRPNLIYDVSLTIDARNATLVATRRSSWVVFWIVPRTLVLVGAVLLVDQLAGNSSSSPAAPFICLCAAVLMSMLLKAALDEPQSLASGLAGPNV